MQALQTTESDAIYIPLLIVADQLLQKCYEQGESVREPTILGEGLGITVSTELRSFDAHKSNEGLTDEGKGLSE